jgi:hypothetical protein
LEDRELAVKVHEFYERVEDYDPVLKAHCRM